MESRIIELLKRKLDLRKACLKGMQDDRSIRDYWILSEIDVIDAEVELLREIDKQYPPLLITYPESKPITEEEKVQIEKCIEEWGGKNRCIIDSSPKKTLFTVDEEKSIDIEKMSSDTFGSMREIAPRVLEKCKVCKLCILYKDHEGDCKDMNDNKLSIL